MRTRDRQRIVGECLLWAIAVGFVGRFAFGTPGFALGLVAALLHAGLRAREATTARWALATWHLVLLPATLAVLLAAMPMEGWILLGPLLLVLWVGTPTPSRLRTGGNPLPARAAALVAMAATMWICAELPVKHLDGIVGPAEYHAIPLPELCERLGEEHGVGCGVAYPRGPLAQRLVDFKIPYPMTRREVLYKLANDTGLRLRIGYCGTGATLLWGAHPSFTHLSPWEVP